MHCQHKSVFKTKYWLIWPQFVKGSSIKYVRKSFRKTNISNPLIRTCTRTCAYQGVRNASFSENFAYVLKSYLRYKTITPQSVLSEAQVKNFFLFRRKIMFRSQDIQVFVVLAIPRFSKSVTSWCILVHETGCIFKYIFWMATH